MLSLLEETRKHQESFRDLKSVEEIIAMCKDLENKESCMQNIVGNLDKMNLGTKTEVSKISFFFSKMHIFVNMTGEVDKCLMVFEN